MNVPEGQAQVEPQGVPQTAPTKSKHSAIQMKQAIKAGDYNGLLTIVQSLTRRGLNGALKESGIWGTGKFLSTEKTSEEITKNLLQASKIQNIIPKLK